MIKKKDINEKRSSMLKITISLLFFCTLFATSAKAQSRGIGVGIIAGQPTGLSLKIWDGKKNAIDAAIGWTTHIDSHDNSSHHHDSDRFYFHVDYLTHVFTLFKEAQGKIPLYYGIGARFVNQDTARLGMRIPLGIAFLVTEAPIDLFFELAPSLDIVPDTEFSLNGAIGIRYFFK